MTEATAPRAIPAIAPEESAVAPLLFTITASEAVVRDVLKVLVLLVDELEVGELMVATPEMVMSEVCHRIWYA